MKKIFSFFHSHPRFTWFSAILWTMIIFIGCSLPGKDLPKLGLFDHFDKVVHLSFFFIFFILWKFCFSNTTFNTKLIIFLALFYGFGLEFYQMHFVAGRSFDIWDGVADGIGALLGSVVWRISSG